MKRETDPWKWISAHQLFVVVVLVILCLFTYAVTRDRSISFQGPEASISAPNYDN